MIKFNLSDLIPIGSLFKSHGVQGQIIGELSPDVEEKCKELKYLFVDERGQSLPIFVEEIIISNEVIKFKFEGIDSPEEATKWANRTLYLDKEMISRLDISLDESEKNLTNFILYNNDELIGTISQIVELPGHSIIKIRENDLLSIPFVEDWIIKVEENKIIMSFDKDILSLNK